MANKADVVIIGGGVMGCAVAYYLAKEGLKPVVIEKGDIGGEASGANGGMVGAPVNGRGSGLVKSSNPGSGGDRATLGRCSRGRRRIRPPTPLFSARRPRGITGWKEIGGSRGRERR